MAWAIGLVTATVPAQGAQTIIPESDAYVSDGAFAGTNFGSDAELAVGVSASGENQESFVRFDLSGQTSVDQATLRVTARSVGNEFNIAGAIYYAVAPAGYVYSTGQDAVYGGRKFNSLATAISALNTSPTTPQVVNILGDWSGGSDVAIVTISGIATTPTNSLVVRALGKARHRGRWTSRAYVLEHPGTSGWALMVENANVTLEGLQIYMPSAPTKAGGAVRARQANILIDACIARGPGLYASTGSNYGSGFNIRDNPSGSTCYLRNCIAYDWLTDDVNGKLTAYAFSMHPGPGDAVVLHNCTAYNSDDGFHSWSGEITATNCLAQACTKGFEGTYTPVSGYNASDLPGDAPGANSLTGFVQFVDEADGDLHLAEDDTLALGGGVDLSTDPDLPVTNDIDGELRSGAWDIGADQAMGTSPIGLTNLAWLTDSGWTETGITWNNRPTDGTYLSSWSPAAGVAYYIDVTDAVNGAINGDGKIVFKLYGTGATVTYDSKEATDPTTRPELLLASASGNTAPSISGIANQTGISGTAVGPLDFTINDAETAAGDLVLTKASSNETLVPTANIVLGGSGGSRTVTITPAAGQIGTTTITLTVSDGVLTADSIFTLTIIDPTAPVITSATSASGQVGSPFTYQIAASNDPTSFDATGLPAGLSVDPATGAITGTPAATGTATVTISATNAAGTG
ncbi:MAG: DNRLRE domain-containing protein, partial [Deltaproteobacteria bacterium]